MILAVRPVICLAMGSEYLYAATTGLTCYLHVPTSLAYILAQAEVGFP